MRHRSRMLRRLNRLVWFYRISCASLITLGLIVLLGGAGFRVNLTPSVPLGLWWIVESERPVLVGDLVFICPPATEEMREARARGYLRFGLCAGRVAPLIKTVVATSGQVIEIDDDVLVDGRPILHSHVARVDGQGREMVPYDGGVVPPGTVFLHSEFPGSFDSRYFGPLPMDGVLGLAREVWTYAP
ncbi:conjugative transfer signal peptidase TraF [Rhizobium sp. TRM96647]|uniref:conjugative transfer signal peptidase TraF n=1 Tax=unclassified Rhizobium TaxID=2613769 RepID=UPI0021E7F8FF|nr:MULTISPECIES: conjugative transfer signal peptidase TraF [unclassified Rhizobium]MCV3739375.1 conjugative transfer signal peptidase TraF [Rhizobium sp. TRM96647]MCV3761041.1 conjugative transfer signal peptidase TraF [Rhizobium sp. TRM96650]